MATMKQPEEEEWEEEEQKQKQEELQKEEQEEGQEEKQEEEWEEEWEEEQQEEEQEEAQKEEQEEEQEEEGQEEGQEEEEEEEGQEQEEEEEKKKKMMTPAVSLIPFELHCEIGRSSEKDPEIQDPNANMLVIPLKLLRKDALSQRTLVFPRLLLELIVECNKFNDNFSIATMLNIQCTFSNYVNCFQPLQEQVWIFAEHKAISVASFYVGPESGTESRNKKKVWSDPSETNGITNANSHQQIWKLIKDGLPICSL
ncbi:hypothetical protein U0070_022364 [Myodes glareolus]|uniref:Ribosomal protein L19e N-terminal domain-containing protein n=1 Tax=Myodes glareolus TaxID=447135 RepID=A0AAW0HZJ4_MYOGA